MRNEFSVRGKLYLSKNKGDMLEVENVHQKHTTDKSQLYNKRTMAATRNNKTDLDIIRTNEIPCIRALGFEEGKKKQMHIYI